MSADPIAERFRELSWRYAPQDEAAVSELENRIAAAGKKGGFITYSDLVRGIAFHFSTLRSAEYTIDVDDWQDLDRAILGDFLGYISMRSYERGKFFASAIVVSKVTYEPSEGFYELLKQLDLIASSKSDKAMYLWSDHVKLAQEWYRMKLRG